MPIKRIHIIGGPGSGKSYLAKKLSKFLKISRYDLDDLKWSTESEYYDTEMPIKIRNKKLNNMLKKKNWIIEGVYYDWVEDSFKKSDVIILLDHNRWLRDINILKRFMHRKTVRHKGKKETLRGIFKMIRWNHQFSNDYFPKAEGVLSKYSKKIKMFSKADHAYEYFIRNK